MSDPIRDRITAALSATHTIERELGGGGMARVFVATERALGRQVVIKTLPDDSWTADAAQRFRREILTAAQLQHANIVPVLAAGDAEGMPYFTMPLVAGDTLRVRMARGPVPLAEAVGILRDVARALNAAHARAVVHRDIKPENILLSADAALVSDFGVAKALSAATQGPEADATMTAVGVSVGTPAYMSPEQVTADPTLDHRADLYAWGVVAYELLGGRRPFAELSGAALVKAQMTETPAPLRTLAPRVPTALADIVMRCLATDPAQRPQSAAELLAALDLPSGEMAATTAAPPRRRLAFAAAAVLVIAVAAWMMLGRSRGRADEATIAVAPFRVGGAAADAQYLREGLGDIIVPQLQTLPNVSAAGMRVMLDRWRRVAGSADEDLDDTEAARAATDAGAGRLILGDVVGTRERLSVNARLLRTRDGRELARARVEGSADSVFSLATRLVTTLLSVSDGDSRERLQAVLSARPEAIAPYLVGEQLYRRGRYAEAGQSFLTAYGADTTFAIAALRIHQVNGWALEAIVPGVWLDRAWTHRARLNGRDSLMLLAVAGNRYPERMPLRPYARLMESLAQQSNDAELWYTFADFLTHNGRLIEEPDVFPRALAAFQRAEAIDSSFAPALEHQAQLQLILGDTGAARLSLQRQARVDSTGDFFRINDYMMQLVGGDRETTRAALDRAVVGSPPSAPYLTFFAVDEEMSGVRADVAEADSVWARFDRLPGASMTAMVARMRREFLWNTGRPSLARTIPIEETDIPGHLEAVMAGLAWDGDSVQAARSVRTLEAFARARPTTDTTLHYAAAQFALAQWALARGDTADVERRQQVLFGVAERIGPATRAGVPRVLGTAIAAQLDQARGAPGARARIESLDSLLRDAPSLDRRLVRSTGNLILAELWERSGEPEAALRVSSRRDFQTAFGMFATARLVRTARLARQLGRRDEERVALRKYVEMRAYAEPRLQPDRERARARLAELDATAER